MHDSLSRSGGYYHLMISGMFNNKSISSRSIKEPIHVRSSYKRRLNNNIMLDTLNVELKNISHLLNEFSKQNVFIELPPTHVNLFETRKSFIRQTIKTVKNFKEAVENFLRDYNIESKKHDEKILYLACICSRLNQALRFLSNEPNAYQRNNEYFIFGENYEKFESEILIFNPCKINYQKVIYDINFHLENIKEIHELSSNLTGCRYELLHDISFPLTILFLIPSICLSIKCGTSSLEFSIYLGLCIFFAVMTLCSSQENEISKSCKQLNLDPIELNYSLNKGA